MAFNKSIILVLSLSSLVSFYAEATFGPNLAPAPAPASVSVPVDPALQRICNMVQYPAECISSIAPLLTVGAPLDSVAVLQAGLVAISTRLQTAIEQARKLKLESKTPEMSGILDQWLKNYELVVESTKKLTAAVPARNFARLETDFDAIIELIYDCEEAYVDGQSTDTKLDNINEALLMIVKNNLAIVKNLLSLKMW